MESTEKTRDDRRNAGNHRGRRPPDWIVVPAGNLGNTSAFGKALEEAQNLGLITDLPKLVSVQAQGARPFVNFMKTKEFVPETKPNTVATAIKIGNPVSYLKAKRALDLTHGMAVSVSDQEILDAKAIIDSSGIGCEPASASTVAAIKNLVDDGTILPSEDIIAILTGNLLKDPQITIDYHKGNLKQIISNFANKIKSI